jgi:hypothetical protein
MLERNASENPRRLQQFEKECAPRIHGWTCDQSLAQIHALSFAIISIFCKSITSTSDSIRREREFMKMRMVLKHVGVAALLAVARADPCERDYAHGSYEG